MTRIDDEGRPLDLQPIGGGSRGPFVLAAVLVLVVVVALTKPWSWGAPAATARPTSPPVAAATVAPSRAVGLGSVPPTPAVTSDVLAPFVTPAPTGEGLLSCLSIDAWRLLTISRGGGRLIRTWTAISPAATGNAATVSTFVRVTDGAVLNVGYCAPIALLKGAAALVTMTAWSVPAAGGGVPQLLGPLRAAYPSGSASRGLYLRPTAIRAMPLDVWPPGRYALHLEAARPDSLDVWIGLEIVAVGGSGG